MPYTKTPTSSLSVIELLIKRVCYRTLAITRRMSSGGISPEPPTTRPSLATRLPLEVVEMIISYLTYDMPSLRAGTLTCYSWYIAAVPLLHHTHTIRIDPRVHNFEWPNPIRHMHKLGLLPLVKLLCVHRGHSIVGLSSKPFNCRTLRQFSALTNVQELDLDRLDIPSFMPKIQRCFGHFSPTVRCLRLSEPRGSRRQIIYFIGLFQHLQDLKFFYNGDNSREELANDLTLIPPFIPPLRGWLTLINFTRVGLLNDMIDLFGGIQFRYMQLFNVDGMRPLLDACAKTLEIVVLHPADPRARSSPQDFDLSQNKSLRVLELPASSIDCAFNNGPPGAASSFLTRVLSTITSPVFYKIIVLYWDRDFRGVKPYPCEVSQADVAEEAPRHHRRFELLREAHKVRNFRLVLSATVSSMVGEYGVRMLEEAVAEEKAKKGFDDIFSEPLVLHNPQRTYPY